MTSFEIIFIIHCFADYRHQEDEGLSSRGSIAMRNAVLKSTPGSGGLRFEVHSTPARGHSTAQKWYMKANHTVEASRWMSALTKSIEWSRRATLADRRSGESDASSFAPPTSLLHTPSLPHKNISAAVSTTSSVAGEELFDHSPDGTDGMQAAVADEQRDPHHETEHSSMEETDKQPPHELTFPLQGNATIAHVELTAQMLHDLLKKNGQPDAVAKTLQESMAGVQSMLTEYVSMVRDREDWWRETLERERQRQNVWEESLRAVVKEGELMESELKTRSRRRSRLIDSTHVSISELGTLKNRPSILGMASPPVPEDAVATPDEELPASPAALPSTARQSPVHAISPLPVTFHRTGSTLSPGASGSIGRRFSLVVRAEQEESVDTDEEDEFFDAIESNTLPNLVVNESLTARTAPEESSVLDLVQYESYKHLRPRLAITSDDRPPMSLWAVLKNSIGKDLTKISFPVFFNEPTSMLQRMVCGFCTCQATQHVNFPFTGRRHGVLRVL